MAEKYPLEIRNAAKQLFLKKWKPSDIAEQLGMASPRVIYQWINKDDWNAQLSDESPIQAINRRLVVLAQKENKSESDFNEIDRLSNALLKMADVDLKNAKVEKEKVVTARLNRGDDPADGKVSTSSKRSFKKKKVKNDISGITEERLTEIREDLFYGYQKRWHKNKKRRTRFILKSRQIGATYYFAWEAFEDAVLTGDNQVFISASKKQAEYFKGYIIAFARKYFEIDLSGETITLSNGAELNFVSTNARTSQGFSGHLYVDEVFWMPDFERLNKLVSGGASQKRWRKTYFSTPSVKSHSAYPMWTGEKWKDSRKGREDFTFNLTNKSLRKGELGHDKIWRNIVTVKDAEKEGCDLFDIDQLLDEYSESEFNNLFMCAFLEAGLSVFKLDDLLAAATDSNVTWVDFKNKAARPYNNLPVWIGYDPARNGDKSTVVVIAPPQTAGAKFRVLEKIDLNGGWAYQANKIERLTQKYNVEYIGIDSTGVGEGVFDRVKEFYPRATAIHYGIETKTRMVLKTQDVVENRRIEWDEAEHDIPQALLQVQQTTTNNDRVTYVADRNSANGHADVAWAIMHALANEPLTGKRKKTRVRFAA